MLKKVTLSLLLAANISLVHAQPASVSASNNVPSDNVVSVYVLIDTEKDLDSFATWLNHTAKLPFNRVIFSFLRPTFPVYTQNSLANSGIMGYFGDGDGHGADAFVKLQRVIQEVRAKQVEAFVSLGGWNYSCNYDAYGTRCGGVPKTVDPVNGFDFDYFPEPNTSEGVQSYHNLVDLVHDLGADGIDWDYEEFWHADKYAHSWVQWESYGPWTQSSQLGVAYANPSYQNVVDLNGGSVDTSAGDKAAIMDATIAKMDNILNVLINYDDAHYTMHPLKWSAAVSAAGGRPIKGFTYGDSKYPSGSNLGIDEVGGIWWGGNLKGIIYELTNKDPQIVNRFDSFGIMSYDICNGATAEWTPIKCSPDGNITDPNDMTLSGQVNTYVHDYVTWLKAGTTVRNAAFSGDGSSSASPLIFRPAKYQITPRIQFGYEVNQPAFPKDPAGQVQLLKSDVTAINSAQQGQTNGVIIWQLFSKQNTSVAGSATIADTIQQSCKTFLSGDDRYDCNASVPNP